jgi:hypothetical protein
MSAAGDGGIGAINGSNHQIWAGGKSFVLFHDLEITGGVGAAGFPISVGSGDSFCYFKNIYLHSFNSGASAWLTLLGNSCVVAGCRMEGNDAVGIYISGNATGSKVSQNWIQGGTGIRHQSPFAAFIEQNIIVNPSNFGIYAPSPAYIHRNSIYSAGGTGVGIRTDAGSDGYIDLVGNVVEGFSGSGGKGYQLSRNMSAKGKNAVYNCNSGYVVTGDVYRDLGDDETLSSSPFAKVGTVTNYADRMTWFTPLNVGNVWAGALNWSDKGAVQHTTSAGGIIVPAQILGQQSVIAL